MAAPAAAAGSAPGLCPGYAVICSFLERYGVLLDLPEFTFPQLERYLSDTSSVPKLLVDLHIKLLRKIGKSVSADRWEKHLVKVCQDFNTTWAWELDKKGYKDMTVECKTGILKYLCECQFDDNVKFKNAINEEDPDKMRLQPIGRDKDGQMYWFQLDQDHNVRVYLEEQDDLDGSSWKCLVRDRNELAEILASLKTHIDPELLKKEQEEAASLKPEADGNKTTDDEDNKKTDDTTEDEEDKASKDVVSPVVSKEEDNKKLKQESEIDVSEAKSLLNDIQHSKTVSEPNTQSDKPCVDVHAKPIKEEPVEVSETTASKATSAKESLSECASRHTEQEDVRKKNTEELQKVMKNDHQAKIPLKKREMKLSEDFDKSSGSIIVRNPSISQVKEPLLVEKINEENDKSGRVKDLSSDNVNLESLYTTDNVKSHNNGLGKASKESEKRNICSDSNEKQTNSLSGDECEPKEKRTKASTDKRNSRVDMDDVARNTEEPIAVAMSTQEEKEKAATQETIVEVVQEVAPLSSSLVAKPSPSSKEPIKPFEKSSDNKDEKNNESNEMCVISHAKGNTCISKETTKALTPEKHTEFDKPKKKGALKGKDSTELSEIEKSDVTKTISEPKPTETIITTDTGKPEHVTHKPDSSTQLKEMPGVIHKMETTLSNKETAEKLHGSKDSEIASVIKKTEVLKQSKGPESKDPGSLVSSKETNKSSVIKQADKTSSSKETERSDSINDKTKLLVMNKVNEQELSEHSKNVNSPKDTQTSCSTGRNSEISGAEVITETSCITGKNSEISEAEVITEKEERVVFKVNSGNSARCQHKEKISNERSGKDSSKPDSKAVDVMAIKDNATQLEDHISIKELPTSKATEKVKEEKNTSLNPVEKGEPSNKVGQLVDNKSEAENKKKKIFDAPKEETLMPLVESSKSEESKMDTTLNAETVTGENKEPKISNETDTRNSESKTIKDHSTAICDTTSAKQPAKIEKEALTPVIDDKSKKDSCSNIEIKSVSLVEKSVKAEDLNKDNDKTSTVDKLEGSKASEEFEDKAKEHNTVNKEKKVEKCDSAEVHEKGIRLKIQVPTRRRKSEVQREERTGDSDSETGGGRSLRRSPRISRPTAKVVEIQDRRLEKLQATASVEKEEEEEEEEEEKEKEEQEGQDEKVVLKKPREKKIDQEGQPKKGKKRRRTRWSSTRTRCNKKGSGDDDDDEDESSEQEDSEDEDDSDEDYKVERGRKRRRNRNRERHSSDSSTSSDDDLPPNDDPCKQCGLPNQPELILLCDSCDNGYHTACLRPPLMIIPDGEWFCPPCQHKQLCDKLEEQLQNIDAALKKRDRAERRKERLVYVGISVENIIAPSIGVEEEKEEVVVKEKKEVKKNKIKSKSWGRRSTRTKKSISYRFDEFDEAIEEAIEEDVKEAEGGGAGRGKDMANITGHRGKDMSTILHGEDGKENGCPPRPSVGQRRKKRRRLNDLDSDSTVDEEESEEEFRLSDSTEEEEFVVSENAESEAEVDFNDSDFGSTGSGPRHTPRSKRPTKRRKSGRQPRKRRNRGYSDDEEEETDEEDEEEEMVTEGSSEFSDSDLDVSRRRSRRSLKKQVNYCETSESEGSKAGTNRDKMKPRRRLSSSDSEASHSRGSEEEEKETRVKRRTVSPSESRKRRRLFSLKRRRASEDDDDDDDDDSDDSEEEDRPVRKRVNRIDSDDSDEEEDDKTSKAEKKDDEGILGKGPNPLEYNLVELPPTNGQNSMKGLEGFINRPEPGAAIGPPGLMGPKNICVTPVGAIAPNGMATQEMVPQDDDEDDLLGVTDLVDYVCNSEQL